MRPWFAVALLLLVPAAAGQTLEDPDGDVEWNLYDEASVAAVGDWGPVDILALEIEETPDTLLWTVDIGGLPTCVAGQCANAGDQRTYFHYGEQGYYVQQGVSALGNAYGSLHTFTEGQINGPVVATPLGATIDHERSAVTVKVPRSLLVDESGTPPVKDRSLTGIHMRSYSQFSFGGPSPDLQEQRDLLTTRDTAGLDAPATFTFTTGGGESRGPIAAVSPAPYRASNGGAALYKYEIQVAYDGTAQTALNLSVENFPADWRFERPAGDISAAPGDRVTFPVLVETPSGHQHGGTDTFTVVLQDVTDPDTWARVELGIHYLTVPQPAGHHPEMFLHTLTDGAIATAAATFGSDDGRIWMNTLDEDPGDEDAGVVAQEGFAGFQSQTSRWSVCTIPNLRLGLDMDITKTGEMQVEIGAGAPHNGVEITGRLLHVGGPDPLDFCNPAFYNDREQTVIATLTGQDGHDLLNSRETFSLLVEPQPAADYIPYEEGAQLVLELEATFTGGDPGPGGLALYEGRMRLPLLEYRDERPQGLVGGPAGAIGGNETLGSFDDKEIVDKESPGAVWPLAALALMAWASGRRR